MSDLKSPFLQQDPFLLHILSGKMTSAFSYEDSRMPRVAFLDSTPAPHSARLDSLLDSLELLSSLLFPFLLLHSLLDSGSRGF